MRVRGRRLVACLLLATAAGCRRADSEAVSAASSTPPHEAAPAVAPRSGVRTSIARPVRLERIGSEHGLSHNTVYAILQDSRGFIWFGTQDGLDRYDGDTFVSYKHDPTDPRSLASSWISALVQDRAGRLWVGTRGGLHQLSRDGRGFVRVSLAAPGDASTDAPSISSLAEGHDGRLWVGTDRGLFRMDPTGDRVAAFRYDAADASSIAANQVRDIRVAADGTPWILTEGTEFRSTLNRFDGAFERIEVSRTSAITFASDGALWLDPRRPTSIAELRAHHAGGSGAMATTALTQDSSGDLWVGTFAGLFRRTASDGELRAIPTLELGAGALSGEVNTIVEDRAGAIWIGTFGGVLRFDPQSKAFDHLTHLPDDADSLSSNAVSAVLEESGGRLWVATYGAGLNEIDGRSGRIVHHRQHDAAATSGCGDYVWDLTPSTQGRIWVSTATGVCRVEGGQLRDYGLPAPKISALTVREDTHGQLWMGTGNGLFVLDPDTRAARFVGDNRDGLPLPVDVLHLDNAGRVWAASGASGDLASYDPETKHVSVFRNVAVEGVWHIAPASDGALWLATGSGLVRFEPSNGQSTRVVPDEREAGSVYYSLLTDADGRVWAGTNKGLIRYDPSTRVFRRFDLGDGIGSLEFNRHAAFAGASQLFFGGMNGVTRFVPSEIRDNSYLPPVVLTTIQTLGGYGERTIDPAGRDTLSLSRDDYAASFEFAALNFTQSQKNRFAYRLQGFDKDWIQAGTRRFARYTNLPPGSYVFQVRGTNNDGVASPLEASLGVLVRPAFWETVWFRLAAGGLVIGGLFVAYKLRIRQLVELEQLRLRIASDLHDEIGSELSGIALASRLVGRRDELSEKDRSRLADVASAAARITASLRDIVWYISPEQDTLQSLEQRMKSVARTMLDGIAHEFHSDGIRPVPLDMDRRQHLFLIYKELLHNILRHANAATVDIALQVHQGVLRLTIADDGVGISGEGTEGSGLKSIRRRAAELGADFAIESGPGTGTRTRLTMAMTRTRRSRRATGQ